MIHHSHSKKDLIEICEVFNIELLDMYDLKKDELVEQLEESLEQIDYIDPETTYYFITDIHDLKRHLEEPNQIKNMSIAEREYTITLARNIIYYCKNGFHPSPKFKDLEDVIRTANIIRQHGDISTIRRALKLLREDNKIRPHIEPILSQRIKTQLKKKEELKKLNTGKLHVSHGNFKVIFDE